MKSFFREFLVTIIAAVVIFLLLQIVIGHFVVISSSMVPSLKVGQHLIIDKISYKFHEPERGDIIVFKHGPPPDLIKRIIALPNETVWITDGTVYIGKSGTSFPLDEPYIQEPPTRNYPRSTVPAGEYFVMGDNRNNSGDSRQGWTVPRKDIIGKTWLSVWPPRLWGAAADYPLPD